MGTRTDHKEKAEHNQEFLLSIDRAKFADWVVTVAFYKALHLVEMLFAAGSKHSDNHRDRHDRLKRDYQAIWQHYLPLYTQSRRARYKIRSISQETLAYVLDRLAKVEQAVNDALKEHD